MRGKDRRASLETPSKSDKGGDQESPLTPSSGSRRKQQLLKRDYETDSEHSDKEVDRSGR